MDPAVLTGILIAILLLLNVEIFVVLGIGAVLFVVMTGSYTLEALGVSVFASLNSFPLLAMPLFILTGDLIVESGIAKLLINFSKSLIGWLRGGLAMTTILTSGFFAAISGSNSATAAAMGKIMVPEMKKENYPDSFAAATVASGGVVGIIIPPSVVFVVYGVATGVPVGDLFLGGIIPGFLMVAAMALVAFLQCSRNKWGNMSKFNMRDVLKSLWGAKLAFIATLIILGGIYGGIFTPTEAGAVACAYCLIAGLLSKGGIKLKKLPDIMENSAKVNGMVAPVVALALVIAEIIAYLKIPAVLVGAIMGISSNPIAIVFVIFFILLVAGCLMETAPNIIILTPLLIPIANSLGFNPIHFGVFVVVSLAIGFITPPIGLNLFVSSSITGVPVTTIARDSLPYVLILMVVALVIAFVPGLSLSLLPTK